MSKALFNLPVLTAASFSIAATIVITAMVFADKPDPPTLLLDQPMPAPDFTVTDHHGDTLTKDDLLGQVWVCDFFLTSCNGVCPVLGRKMADLAAQLAEDPAFDSVRLVSFSVDPETDTVQRLQAYRNTNMSVWSRGSASRKDEIDRRWVHARAQDNEAFWQIVREGFKLSVGPASPEDKSTPVAHSSRFVLVDRKGNIRGTYEAYQSDEDLIALRADLRRLIEEQD
jgi:cytochrome oxidase Cu insertion factor (SCO1/SenC/PrrC family)